MSSGRISNRVGTYEELLAKPDGGFRSQIDTHLKVIRQIRS